MTALPRRARALALPLCLLALPASAQDMGAVFDLLCGRTVHYYNVGVGNQIEYTAPDGRAYLWFNGREDVVIGTWDVTEVAPDTAEICFTYPPGSFVDDGENRYCFTTDGLFDDVVERGVRDGDPYDLVTGEPPFVLPFEPELPRADFETRFPDRQRAPGCTALVS